MKVAALQIFSEKNVSKNVDMACELIEQAAQMGAGLVVLPEEFATLGLTTLEKREVMETFGNGPIQNRLQNAAKKNHVWIVGGTLLIKDKDDKPFSSTLVWNDKGECVTRYDKLHLFDVKVASDEYRESDNIKKGSNIVVLETPFGKLGFAICYDLRFPELFRLLMLKGAQILLLPSAFTMQTGFAHWEILVRARAIENLCYVIAPGECGKRSDDRLTYGHSMIVGPWGDVLASAQDEPGVIIAELDMTKLQAIRQQFPAINHVRKSVLQALANEVNP
ncbi:MAG: carbon-nitrogen hydrolase family protein [Candidatus Berkiella sp.]